MCTVSFVSSGNESFITSNRDEHISRPTSLKPKEEFYNGCKIIYPKDSKAGGTWFAVNGYGTVAVLLNGAFKKHVSRGAYTKSRGLILLDVIGTQQPTLFLDMADLENIEPFTLILFDKGNLLEFRWDGYSKHFKKYNTAKSYIWSSATLYSAKAVEKREALFANFLTRHNSYTSDQIIDFHMTNNGDYENGFIIDRNTGLKTLSVTQVCVSANELVLHYFDLLKDTKYSTQVSKQPIISTL